MSEYPKGEVAPNNNEIFGPSFTELSKAFAREGLLMSQIGAKMYLYEIDPPEEVRKKMLEKHIPELNEARTKTQEAIAKWLEVIGGSQE